MVILDIVSDATVRMYRDALRDGAPHVVLLLPTFEEIQRRTALRPPRITANEPLAPYRDQAALGDADRLIDTTDHSPDDMAERLSRRKRPPLQGVGVSCGNRRRVPRGWHLMRRLRPATRLVRFAGPSPATSDDLIVRLLC